MIDLGCRPSEVERGINTYLGGAFIVAAGQSKHRAYLEWSNGRKAGVSKRQGNWEAHVCDHIGFLLAGRYFTRERAVTECMRSLLGLDRCFDCRSLLQFCRCE